MDRPLHHKLDAEVQNDHEESSKLSEYFLESLQFLRAAYSGLFHPEHKFARIVQVTRESTVLKFSLQMRKCSTRW